MELDTLRGRISQLPALLEELSSRFSGATGESTARAELCEWFVQWHERQRGELWLILEGLRALQEAACDRTQTSLELKQAAKDSIDLELLLRALSEQLNSLCGSIGHEMRYAHLWRLWETKIVPIKREVVICARKLRIALAGL